MSSFIRFSLYPLIFFPLLYVALLSGGINGWIYFIGFVGTYVLLDFLFPNCSDDINQNFSSLYNTALVSHIPLSVVALILLFWQLYPQHEWLKAFASNIGYLIPFIDSITPVNTKLELFGLIVSCGFMFGHNTAVAHELMHRKERFFYEVSRFLFAMCGDAQVVISHIHSHHQNVATQYDSTSAVRKDTVYRHFFKAIIGQYKDSWSFEKGRLSNYGFPLSVLKNQVVNGVLMTIAMLLVVFWTLGIQATFTWMVVMFLAKWLLESLNYVQHYGLIRVPGEKIEPRHSWETSAYGSTIGLYNATSHGQHHVNGNLPFWKIKHTPSVPSHKYGYMVAISLAMLPKFWFIYVNPLLKKWDDELATAGELQLLKNRRLLHEEFKNFSSKKARKAIN